MVCVHVKKRKPMIKTKTRENPSQLASPSPANLLVLLVLSPSPATMVLLILGPFPATLLVLLKQLSWSLGTTWRTPETLGSELFSLFYHPRALVNISFCGVESLYQRQKFPFPGCWHVNADDIWVHPVLSQPRAEFSSWQTEHWSYAEFHLPQRRNVCERVCFVVDEQSGISGHSQISHVFIIQMKSRIWIWLCSSSLMSAKLFLLFSFPYPLFFLLCTFLSFASLWFSSCWPDS